MGAEAGQQDSTTGDDTETGQDAEGQQAGTTPETGGNGDQQQAGTTVTIDDSTQLPDTHPLVKTLAANKDKISKLQAELRDAQSNSAKATQLEEELGKRPTSEALETLQTRYDRLEGFLLAAGGPLAKALDSRTFSKDLFETDKDIATLVTEFNRANPSATSTALGSGAAAPAAGKMNPNDLLRIAAGKQ